VIPGKPYTPELVFQLAWRRKWLIVLPAIAIAAGVAAWTYQLPDRYRSDTLILVVPQRVPENYVRSTVTTRVEDRLQVIGQQILSRTRLERIIQDLNLYPEARKTQIMEDIVERMRDDIETPVIRGDAFRVSFTSEDPRTAMRVAERLASMYIDESLRDREVLAEGTNQFLESQLEDARRQLLDIEKKLEDYRRRHDGQLPTQLNANIQGVHNTEMQLQSLIDSLNRDRDRHLVLERTLADSSLVESLSTPIVPAGKESAAAQLRVAQDQLRAMELRLKPEHPDILRARRTIAELQERADEEAAAGPVSDLSPDGVRRTRLDDMRTELENLDKQITFKTAEEKRLRGVIGQYQQRIEATPTRESELVDLMRDYGTMQGAYQSLLAKKQDSQISTNLERRQIGEQFKILDPARLPTRPFSPNRPRLYLMGIVGGFAFGLTLVALLEYLDRRLRSEEDIRAVLNLPVLATIPWIHETSEQRRGHVVAISVSAATMILVGAVVIAWRILR
jgi:polysaccharide chain length determinant protein (PEP-CTERM system associated)